MLVPSVVARPLEGEPPTVELVMGYSKSNTSALLKRFLARTDELVAGVQNQSSSPKSNRADSKRPGTKR
jgi:LysR family hca operon transcriptional activator